MKHTPTPLVLSENVNDTGDTSFAEFCIEDANGDIVMFLKNGELAAFIVRACNAHGDLVEALSDIITAHEIGMGRSALMLRLELARAALAKAKGEQ